MHLLVFPFILFLGKVIGDPAKLLWRMMIQIGIPNEATPSFRDPSKSAYCDQWSRTRFIDLAIPYPGDYLDGIGVVLSL